MSYYGTNPIVAVIAIALAVGLSAYWSQKSDSGFFGGFWVGAISSVFVLIIFFNFDTYPLGKNGLSLIHYIGMILPASLVGAWAGSRNKKNKEQTVSPTSDQLKKEAIKKLPVMRNQSQQNSENTAELKDSQNQIKQKSPASDKQQTRMSEEDRRKAQVTLKQEEQAAVQREKALQAPEQQSKQLEIDKQNEIRMKAEDQAKGLGSMQYSTDTADKEEDNQVYEIAEMAIKYRPEVKKAYDDLREYPEEVKFTFLKNMNENPKQNPDDLFKKIIKEYDEKRNPFALEITNTAYKNILEVDKKLAQEFINIVNILGEENINPNLVKNELLYSFTTIIEEGVFRSEQFKFNYAYKIKKNGVFLIQDEKGNWLEFEGEQAAREKLYIPKFITKTIKS